MNEKPHSPSSQASKVSGLSSLFNKDKNEPALSVVSNVGAESIQELALEKLIPGKYQPRTDFNEEALLELADSIKATGVIEPVVVRPIEDEQFEIIAGERRCRASKIAGKTTIPAIVRDMDDSTTAAVAMIENIQREDLSPMEEARGIQQLMDEFQLNQKATAEVLSKKPDDISKLLKLLALPDCLNQLYEKGVTSPYTLDSLHRAFKENPEATEQFVEPLSVVTKQDADSFLKSLKSSEEEAGEKTQKTPENNGVSEQPQKTKSSKTALQVEVIYQGYKATLDLTRRSDDQAKCWIHSEGQSQEVLLQDISLHALL